MTPLPDKSVVEKESFTLECEVSKPNKPATWSKDGKPLEPSDRVQMFVDGTKHTLIVNNSILDDEAKYTITVEEAESTGNVTVQGVYLLVHQSDTDNTLIARGRYVICLKPQPGET